ncbi:MAG: sigma-70 family RNA polymerase sigma factor [Alphaproteobacteria bacterium]
MSFRDELVAQLPRLRAFAISLCGRPHQADDLVQETLMKALSNRDKFEEGSNIRAWLFTILRNVYFSHHRKMRREVEDIDDSISKAVPTRPEQDGHIEMAEFRQALQELPESQREALLLVGAAGFSYEEAAQVAGCAVGTVKSRVSRARIRLAEMLETDTADDADPQSGERPTHAGNLTTGGARIG